MADRKENFSNVILNNPQKRNIYFALAGVTILVLVVGFWIVSKNKGPAQIGGGTNLSATPAISATPGTSTSPEYNKKVQNENERAAEEALKTGEGFVPRIVNDQSFNKNSPIDMLDQEKERQRIEDEQNRAKQAALDEEQRRKEDAERLAIQQKNQQLQQQEVEKQISQPKAETKKYSMDDYVLIAAATNIWRVKDTVSEFDYAREKQKEQKDETQFSQSENNGESNKSSTDSATQAAPTSPYASAGTIFNAILETGIDSDEPSPVLAKIVSGELKGAKLLGKMNKSGEKVVVEFNTISLPGKSTSLKIQAVAVDPSSSRTGLASDVDRHYFLRYGVLLASTFLSGYAEAIAQQGTSVVNASTGYETQTKDFSAKEINQQAIGKVGTEVANSIKSQNIQTTITVENGTAIGILLMSDLTIDK